MYRLLIVSDSHHDLYNMEMLLRETKDGGADALIHLGDCAEDGHFLTKKMPRVPFYGVRGNCDLFSSAEGERIETFGGVRTLLCHGHAYSVKSGIALLADNTRQKGCTLALFGHTHRRLERFENGVFLINPGALRDGFYAWVDITEDGTPYATFETL